MKQLAYRLQARSLHELHASLTQTCRIGEPKWVTGALPQIGGEVESLHDRYFNSPLGAPLKCALTLGSSQVIPEFTRSPSPRNP